MCIVCNQNATAPFSSPSSNASDSLDALNNYSDIKDTIKYAPTTHGSPNTFWYCCYCHKHNSGWKGPYNEDSHVTCFECEHQRCKDCKVETGDSHEKSILASKQTSKLG